MLLYVESNFVLKLALRDENADCSAILEASEQKRLELVVPELALFEPLYTLRGRRAKRLRQGRRWKELARELRRSDCMAHQSAATQLLTAHAALEGIAEEDRNSLAEVVDRLWACSRVIGNTRQVFSDGYLKYERMGLKEADALVLAVILSDAKSRSEPRAFLSLDKHFLGTTKKSAPLKEEIRGANLRLLRNVRDCLKFLDAEGCLPGDQTLKKESASK